MAASKPVNFVYHSLVNCDNFCTHNGCQCSCHPICAARNSPLRSSPEWAKEYADKFTIMDPDGWDRSPEGWEKSWNEPICREEFERRVTISTCRYSIGWMDSYLT